jgi:hypothetical protein
LISVGFPEASIQIRKSDWQGVKSLGDVTELSKLIMQCLAATELLDPAPRDLGDSKSEAGFPKSA